MENALKILNELENKGFIARYAIGGGMAVLFHAEPVLTYDLDVFVFLPRSQEKLINLSPIYDYLKKKGYKAVREHVEIKGVPVQIIPAYNNLIEEAVKNAVEVNYGKTRTRVLSGEYLIAIFLQTNRPKDKNRVLLLWEEAKIKKSLLEKIFKRHGLTKNWIEFRRRFNLER